MFLKSEAQFVTILLFIWPTIIFAQYSRGPCFVDIAVYDAKGDRQNFKITGVYAREGEAVVDFLRDPMTKGRLRIDGSRVYFFGTAIPTRHLEVKITAGKDTSIVADFVLEQCHSRLSVTSTEADNDQDAGPSFVDGRLIGCSVSAGNWWIRAMPMFYRLEPTEAYVDPKDGSFSVAAYRGFRYVVVVGKGKIPLKVLGADVTRGGVTTHLGNVDVSSVCQGQ